MRLALLTPFDFPSVHGNAITVNRIARGLREVGVAMRVPVSIRLDALAIVFDVPPEALSGIVTELVARGAGMSDAGTWTIANQAHVAALIAALVVYAG